jgi:hypothetical protein
MLDGDAGTRSKIFEEVCKQDNKYRDLTALEAHDKILSIVNSIEKDERKKLYKLLKNSFYGDME